MFKIHKRIFSLILSVMIIVMIPLQVLADTPGGSSGSRIPAIVPGGKGYISNPAPIFRDYGFRVTITDSTQLSEPLQDLSGAYTDDDLDNQRNNVEEYLKHIYIRPGDEGIYFWKRLNTGISPNYGVTSSYPGTKFAIKNNRITMMSGTSVTDEDNKLAWLCYEGLDGFKRTEGRPAYNENMGKALLNAAGNYGSSGDFLYHMRSMFMQACGFSDAQMKSYIIDVLSRVISDGNNTAENIRQFSWDTSLYTEAGVPPAGRVQWSRIGYLTMLIQFAWLADYTGNTSTFEQFKTKIWNYITGGYKSSVMPLLEIEACQEVGEDGTPRDDDENCQLIPMSYMLRTQYGGDVIEALYSGWNAGISIRDELLQVIGTKVPVSVGVVSQGLGYYFSGGIYHEKYADRAFHRLLFPSSDMDASYGYLIAFTYAADSVASASTGNANAMGAFTWKLDPNGVHDVTPDEEIDASSTVYNINMSQSGYNKNNYSDWESYVNGYGNDNNKIKVTIYRTSESLEKDQKAQKYERGQVVNGGTAVPDTVDRVVVVDSL